MATKKSTKKSQESEVVLGPGAKGDLSDPEAVETPESEEAKGD